MGLFCLSSSQMQREPEKAQHLYHFPCCLRADSWLWEGKMDTSEYAPDLVGLLHHASMERS